MGLFEKMAAFWKREGFFVGALVCTIFWCIIFVLFLYAALFTDYVFHAPVPKGLDALIVVLAYCLPISVLATIFCIWRSYKLKKYSWILYSNLLPFFIIVIIIPVFLLLFSLGLIFT